ncbi:MAG: 3-phosphoshikimate 1-carboxyvinyltransferase [Parvicellaceae bacterium]|jgi:3-phosphoshikimate 1-carboxyvinyltransferase
MVIVYQSNLKGEITANASKSMMQRTVAAALLANGVTTIFNPGNSNDCKAALQIVRDLGAEVVQNESISIRSSSFIKLPTSISCGESGLGIRMFTPIMSVFDNAITINGSGSLLTRPMNFFEEVLPQLGVQCTSNQGKIPIKVKGPIQGAEINLDGSLTSQFLTGLIMALPLAKSDSILNVDSLKSRGYVDLTINVLKKFGIEIKHSNYKTFHIRGNQKYVPAKITIDGDWSGAAFHLVGGAISGHVTLKSLSNNSNQPDKQILKAIEKAGGHVKVGRDSITVQKESLNAFKFDATDCPDLFPPLAALAANCDGNTILKGTSRLKHKESDRATVIKNELNQVGIKVDLIDDSMIIYGGKVTNGTIDSHNDHRIAMMGAILALNSSESIRITNSSAINKSYPKFYEHLEALGGKLESC